MEIRLSGVIKESIVDGPGIRYVVFTQGCIHNCYQCQNQGTHDLNGGFLEKIKNIVSQINSSKYISGVTLSGGEPLLQINECLRLLEGLDSRLDVICYTGFTFEEICNMKRNNHNLEKVLDRITYLIDGKFEHQNKSLDLNFRGSSNQRIIDLKRTIKSNSLVLVDL